jgi:hypothetical protein
VATKALTIRIVVAAAASVQGIVVLKFLLRHHSASSRQLFTEVTPFSLNTHR